MIYLNWFPKELKFLFEGLEEYFQPVNPETHEVVRRGNHLYLVKRDMV